jgi:hypothetical protein
MHILCSFRRLYRLDRNDLGKESEEKGFSFELLLILWLMIYILVLILL